jgi:pimeloyl-ACP methyl ester carboxylesterase
MRKLLALFAASASLAAFGAQPPTRAPNVAGTWQAILPVTPQGIRMVVRITAVDAGGWNATMYRDDTDPIPVQSVMVGGSAIEFISNRGRYQGEISADGRSIRGIWIHGYPRPVDPPLPLELQRATRHTEWSLPPHSSPHTTRYVTVDQDANLEVLDWGGSGRPVVLLAGLGSDAHFFDQFAPKLTPRYHVYGITRRGFGNSSVPLTGYSADRLGDDVLAVIDTLHLVRPILVGHSIAGEELSSVGSRYPQRVAGLIYLEAAYQYAYYDPGSIGGDGLLATIDIDELQSKLDQLRFGNAPADPRPLIQDLLNRELPRVTQSLLAWQRNLAATPPTPEGTTPSPARVRRDPPMIAEDVEAGLHRYTGIPTPILAIFRVMPGWAQSDVFEKGVPSAHVVRLAQASHDVIRSNEADVLREMDAFIDTLPQ